MNKITFFAKSFFKVAAANVITKPLWFLLFIYAARKLGVNQFGIYTYSFSIVIIVSIIIDFGFDYIAIKEISISPEKAFSYFPAIFITRTVITLTIFVIIFLLYSVLNLFTYELFSIISLILAFQLCVIHLQFIRGIISAFQNFSLYSKLLLFEKSMLISLGFITLFFSQNLYYFLLALSIGNIISVLLFLFILERKHKINIVKFSLEVISELFRKSFPLLMMNAFILAYFRVDVLLLEWLTNDNSVVGVYGSIRRILDMYFLLPSILMSTAFPILSLNYMQDKPYAASLIINIIKVLIFLSMPIVILFAFSSYDMNYLLFGEEYKSGSNGMIYLIWTILPLGLNYLLGHILIVLDKQKYCALSLSIASVFNITLNLILIPKLSFVGACISMLLTESIIFVLYANFVVKYFKGLNILEFINKLLMIIVIIFVSSQLIEVVFGYSKFINTGFLILFTIILMINFKVITGAEYRRLFASFINRKSPSDGIF